MTRCSSVAPQPPPASTLAAGGGPPLPPSSFPFLTPGPVFSHSDVRARTSSHVAEGGRGGDRRNHRSDVVRTHLPQKVLSLLSYYQSWFR